MINWIKKFFVTEKKESKPKCFICGLGAKYHMLIEFKTMELEEVNNKILIKICGGCYDKINERYNPKNEPPIIQVGVFESKLGYGTEKKKKF